MRCGVDLSALSILSTGELFDIIEYHFDDVLRAKGKNVIDYDEQYEKMLKIKPQIEAAYKSGQITEEKYNQFMKRFDELTE